MSADRLPLPPGGRAPDDVWWIEPEGKIRLRAALWEADDPVGHVIFLTGRTEFLEKVAIPAEQFVQRGYSVISLDWRGQGLSSRQVSPALKGHVGHFDEFQTDLDALLNSEQARRLSGKRILVGHSMGGCISTHALARDDVRASLDAAILCAPMLGIQMNPIMRFIAWITVKIAFALGKETCWPPFGDVSTPYVLTEPDDNVLTSDAEVMNWMVRVARERPESSIAMPTLQWFQAATDAMKVSAKLPAPGLPVLYLLGECERVVGRDAVRAGAARMNAKLECFPGAQHELFIENETIREKVWLALDRFLDANDLPRRS